MHIRFSCTTFDLTFQKQAGSTTLDNFLMIYENLYAIIMYDVSAAPFKYKKVPDLLTGLLRQMRDHIHFSCGSFVHHVSNQTSPKRLGSYLVMYGKSNVNSMYDALRSRWTHRQISQACNLLMMSDRSYPVFVHNVLKSRLHHTNLNTSANFPVIYHASRAVLCGTDYGLRILPNSKKNQKK
jgi:hypothetical protein